MHTNDHKRISKETNLPRDCASSLKLCRQATSAGWSDRLGNELKIPDRLTHPRGWTWTVLQNACTDNHRYAQLYDSNISCPILYDSIVVHLCSSKFIFRSVQRNISQHLPMSSIARSIALSLSGCGTVGRGSGRGGSRGLKY